MGTGYFREKNPMSKGGTSKNKGVEKKKQQNTQRVRTEIPFIHFFEVHQGMKKKGMLMGAKVPDRTQIPRKSRKFKMPR